jgi:hypothetical protein
MHELSAGVVSHGFTGCRKSSSSVILSEAKNLSSIQVQAKKQGGILRFAQNDKVLCFSAACLAGTFRKAFNGALAPEAR